MNHSDDITLIDHIIFVDQVRKRSYGKIESLEGITSVQNSWG